MYHGKSAGNEGQACHTNRSQSRPLPSPEAVREQLQAILASRPFITATRARRFLTYIVEQTLAGQTDAIKELVLGIEVFDRPADFDPKVDTIVRVEAGKLRKRLEEYYADEGVSAAVRIDVPKGSLRTAVPVLHQTARPCRLAAGTAMRPAFSRCYWSAPAPGEHGDSALPRRR